VTVLYEHQDLIGTTTTTVAGDGYDVAVALPSGEQYGGHVAGAEAGIVCRDGGPIDQCQTDLKIWDCEGAGVRLGLAALNMIRSTASGGIAGFFLGQAMVFYATYEYAKCHEANRGR
jgi:hypothetical protein